MKKYSLFGNLQPELVTNIEAAGGKGKADGRELILTFAIQDYLANEIRGGVTFNEVIARLTRALGRGVVSTAATLHKNDVGMEMHEICNAIMAELASHADQALRLLPQTEMLTSTVIHKNHRSPQ